MLAGQLLALGGWVRTVPDASPESMAAIPDGRADVVVSGWTAFRPGTPEWDEQLASARRVLRPDGRLLVVHDYGRDEVTGLFADPTRAAERIGWSRPGGPFLGQGFRVRVLHCWWQWDTQAEATEVLTLGFGEAGAAVAAGMRRPTARLEGCRVPPGHGLRRRRSTPRLRRTGSTVPRMLGMPARPGSLHSKLAASQLASA